MAHQSQFIHPECHLHQHSWQYPLLKSNSSFQWSRGTQPRCNRITTTFMLVQSSFNGAEAFNLGVTSGSLSGTTGVHASMGPRSLTSVKQAGKGQGADITMLQWSRGIQPRCNSISGTMKAGLTGFNGAEVFNLGVTAYL